MILLTDSWQGNPDLNEQVLKANGIYGNICRFNGIQGDFYVDKNFGRQWDESNNTLTLSSLYFVYNPWELGEENFNWLWAQKPRDIPYRIFIDIELKNPKQSPSAYAVQVNEFLDRVYNKGYAPAIYTGGWFLSALSKWPKQYPYWWARYPYLLYPSGAVVSTWDNVRNQLQSLGWQPDPAKKCPGPVKIWQCSGDRLILPGAGNHPIDVNVWNGTEDELMEWWTGKVTPTVPKPPLSLESLDARITAIEDFLVLP